MNWQIYDDKQILTVSIPLKMRVIEKKKQFKSSKGAKKKLLSWWKLKRQESKALCKDAHMDVTNYQMFFSTMPIPQLIMHINAKIYLY
jgi:hypothetical protein